jgi:GTP-dependent dephospho-CoA kinase
MVTIPASIRAALKTPLGRLQKDFSGLKELGASHRIISVGDVCTLGLLGAGIRPHLAVFDHLFMRHDLPPERKRILESAFRNPSKYSNPPGTLSESLIADAPMLIEKGGAVLIDGEEDLTALAFIRSAGKKDIIIYGQPGEGLVVVVPDERLKKKIDKWLSAAALGHEIEGGVGENR